MNTRMGGPSPRRDRGAAATEYGLMVTLISVLVGGIVAGIGAHLFPDPCSLFPTICADQGGSKPADPQSPGNPGSRPTAGPTGSPSESPTESPSESPSESASPSGSVSSSPCPSASADSSTPGTCPSTDPSADPSTTGTALR